MSNEFMREERYIVFKISDVERYLTDKDRANITMMKMEIDAGRDCANKPPFKGLIVEADWPEYEPTWKAIEARVNGVQQVPDRSAVQTAARIMNIELIRERDALRAKVEEMEKQEPVFWWRPCSDGTYEGPLHNNSIERVRKLSGAWSPLYALPGAQPAPSVPEGWQLVPTAESRHPGIYKMLGALHAADNTPGMSEWESYRAMLSEAPEAKP